MKKTRGAQMINGKFWLHKIKKMFYKNSVVKIRRETTTTKKKTSTSFPDKGFISKICEELIQTYKTVILLSK